MEQRGRFTVVRQEPAILNTQKYGIGMVPVALLHSKTLRNRRMYKTTFFTVGNHVVPRFNPMTLRDLKGS